MILEELGTLPPGTLVSEKWLAERFGRCVVSIKRAVSRGELPAPATVLGENRWTIGAIVRHIEKRIEQETQLVDQERADLRQREKAAS
jgi:hypothetical protein